MFPGSSCHVVLPCCDNDWVAYDLTTVPVLWLESREDFCSVRAWSSAWVMTNKQLPEKVSIQISGLRISLPANSNQYTLSDHKDLSIALP